MSVAVSNVIAKMENERTNKNDAYFKLFCKFLTENNSTNTYASKDFRRRQSFVYMELLVKSNYSKTSKPDSFSPLAPETPVHENVEVFNNDNKPERIASNIQGDGYLARIMTIQSRDEPTDFKNITSLSSSEIPSSSTLCTSSESPKRELTTTKEEEILAQSPSDEFNKSSFASRKNQDDVDFWNISESNSPITRLSDWVEKQQHSISTELKYRDAMTDQRHQIQNEGTEFFPTLASIEESDENEFSENDNCNRKSFRSRSKSWSMEHISEQLIKSSLYKSKTYENLSADEFETSELDKSQIEENKLTESEQMTSSDLNLNDANNFTTINSSEIKESNTIDKRSNCSTPTTIKVVESEELKTSTGSLNNLALEVSGCSTPINLEYTVFEETEYPFAPKSEVPVLESSAGCCPLQPQNPPVIVVDSLEDYVKTLIPERVYKSRNASSRQSFHSSYTDSAYSSRERIDTLHLSTPDLSFVNFEDSIDCQYIPISYAEIKRKRARNKVKRSVSDVHDSYYFSKESSASRLNTLKRQLVRKMSKRNRKLKQLQAEDSSETSSNYKSPVKQKKLTRHSSFRGAMKRLIRRIRRRDNDSKKYSLERRRTWSLPTQLDSYSSSDYYATESEATT